MKSDAVLVGISHYSMAFVDSFSHFEGLKTFLWAYSEVEISLTFFWINAFLVDARLTWTWTQKHRSCVHESFFVDPLHEKALLGRWLKHLFRRANRNNLRCRRLSQLAVLLFQLFLSLDLNKEVRVSLVGHCIFSWCARSVWDQTGRPRLCTLNCFLWRSWDKDFRYVFWRLLAQGRRRINFVLRS